MPNVAPISRLLRLRTARRPRPGAVAPSLGLQRPHFAAANAGQGGVITPLESAGSAVMALIGDFSDSSGTNTIPQAALWARRQAQPGHRRGARAQCQLGVFLVPVGFREAAAMASRWTPSTRRPPAKKKTEHYLTPGDPIFVEVAFPSASFSFDVDFWWSFVWSFTPCKMVTMFVSSTIPAITISSRM